MFFILNPSTKGSKQTFGFTSTFNPPQMAELKQFEDELFALVSSIMYRLYKNQLQDKMRADRTKILTSDSVIVQADKSSNMYKMSVDKYKKKLKDNITRDYRKASRSDVDEVTKEATAIARTYNLDDRIDIPTEDEAFITIKDHKDSLPSRVECWLINPARQEQHWGHQQIHPDRVNTTIRSSTLSNQWKNTSTAINWFSAIQAKPKKTFSKFDIASRKS